MQNLGYIKIAAILHKIKNLKIALFHYVGRWRPAKLAANQAPSSLRVKEKRGRRQAVCYKSNLYNNQINYISITLFAYQSRTVDINYIICISKGCAVTGHVTWSLVVCAQVTALLLWAQTCSFLRPQASLSSANLLQFLNFNILLTSMPTASYHLPLGLPAGLFLFLYTFSAFFGTLLSFILITRITHFIFLSLIFMVSSISLYNVYIS